MVQSTLTVPSGDYVAPGLAVILPDAAFANMVVGSTVQNAWPHMRRDVGHNWYVDKRNPTVGFVNRDEAAILYNTAQRFAGRPCLEIGCWRGWSTAHIALGCGQLDVIDPMLADAEFAADVKGSLDRAGVLDRVVLHIGPSPAEVEAIAQRTGIRWAFIFIDGDHEDDAPARDAAIVARYAAADALVLFHDLLSPDVARGLSFFRDAGWNTMVYQTAQVMGVAWRGAVEPVGHVADPTQPWWLPPHLASYRVSGEPTDRRIERVGRIVEASVSGDGSAADNFIGALAGLPALSVAATPVAGEPDGLDRLLARVDDLVARAGALAEAADAAAQFDGFHQRYLQLSERLTQAETDRARLASDLAVAHADRAKLRAELDETRDDRETAVRFLEQNLGRRLPARLMDEQTAAPSEPSAERDFIAWLARPRVLLGLLRRRAQFGPDAAADLIVRQAAACDVRGLRAGIAAWLVRTRVLLGLLRRRVVLGRAGVEALLSRQLIDRSAGPPGAAEAEYRRMAEVLKALETAKIADERALLDAQIEIATLRAQLDGRLTQQASGSLRSN